MSSLIKAVNRVVMSRRRRLKASKVAVYRSNFFGRTIDLHWMDLRKRLQKKSSQSSDVLLTCKNTAHCRPWHLAFWSECESLMPPVYSKGDVGTFYPQPSVSVRHIDARRPAPNGKRPIPASITSTTASYTSLEPNSWRESCLIFFYLKLSGGAPPIRNEIQGHIPV